jgi:hypothetical protein
MRNSLKRNDLSTYTAGQAFETSEGRVHRAYNLGAVDAIEYNMFVGPIGRRTRCSFRRI